MNQIQFRKQWQDVHLQEYSILCNSQNIRAQWSMYFPAAGTTSLAQCITEFCDNPAKECSWENAPDGLKMPPYLSMRFSGKDRCGHVLIRVELCNTNESEEYTASFTVEAELGALTAFAVGLQNLANAPVGTAISLY